MLGIKKIAGLCAAVVLWASSAHAITFDFDLSSTTNLNTLSGLSGEAGSLTLTGSGSSLSATLDLPSATGAQTDSRTAYTPSILVDPFLGLTASLLGSSPLLQQPGDLTSPSGVALTPILGNFSISIVGTFTGGGSNADDFVLTEINWSQEYSSTAGDTFTVTENFSLSNIVITGVTPPAVPLPATAPLLVAGLGAVALMRRRKQRGAAS